MESSTNSRPQPIVVQPALAGLRRQFLAMDVLIIGFIGGLIAWGLLSMVVPSARLYPYDAQFRWAEIGHLNIMLQLAAYLLAYLAFQRFGIAHHRMTHGQGVHPPAWLSVANVLYVLSPIAIIPFVFNLLGGFIAEISGAPGVQHHAAFSAATSYDPAATYWDAWLKDLDTTLFGVYVPQWMRQFHAPWLTGVLMVCYLAYYVSPLVAIVPQMARRNWPVVRRICGVYAACLLTTYVGYILVPATGPRFEGGMKTWLPVEPGWFGAQWWAHVIDDAEIIRWDAFPSGHVAVALVTLVLALRYQRWLGLAYLPFVAGLCVATMYLGYHYATDVLVGFVVAVLTFAVFEPAIRWWERVWAQQEATTPT